MPGKTAKPKKGPAKPKRAAKTTLPKIEEIASQELKFDGSDSPAPKSKKRLLIVILLLAIAGLLGYRYKEMLIVAMINGRPVFRHELNQRLLSSYGKSTLENLLVEKLIQEEARKQKISITEKNIDEEVAKISQDLGDTKIEDILSLQGMTLKDFRDQLQMRLQVNKILEKEITISDEEVENYLKENAQSLTETDEAKRKEEARENLLNQKIAERVQGWIGELLSKAKIDRYLK
jgi:foldase protein PrsA